MPRDLLIVDVLCDLWLVNRFKVVQHLTDPVFLGNQRLPDKGIDVVADDSDSVFEVFEELYTVARICIERVGITCVTDAPKTFFDVVDFAIEKNELVAPLVGVAGKDSANPIDGGLSHTVDSDSFCDSDVVPEALNALAKVDVCACIVTVDLGQRTRLCRLGEFFEEVFDHLEFQDMLCGESFCITGSGRRNLTKTHVKAVVVVCVAICRYILEYLSKRMSARSN